MSDQIIWNIVGDTLPPTGKTVLTLSEGGIEQELVYKSNLWWYPDRPMYIYYTPKYWRLING